MSETLQNLSNMTLIKYVQTQFFKFDVNPTHLWLLNSGPVKSCHNDKFFLIFLGLHSIRLYFENCKEWGDTFKPCS